MGLPYEAVTPAPAPGHKPQMALLAFHCSPVEPHRVCVKAIRVACLLSEEYGCLLVLMLLHEAEQTFCDVGLQRLSEILPRRRSAIRLP